MEHSCRVFFTVFIEIALIIYSIFLSENALVSQEVLFVILILFLVFDLLGIYLYHILQVEEQLHHQLALSRQKMSWNICICSVFKSSKKGREKYCMT